MRLVRLDNLQFSATARNPGTGKRLLSNFGEHHRT
jgi:hypothetical protein